MRRLLNSCLFLGLLLGAAGCGADGPTNMPAGDGTPTMHPMFDVSALGTLPPAPVNAGLRATPTASEHFAYIPSRTPAPLPTLRLTSTPTTTALPGADSTVAAGWLQGRFGEIVLFDERLDANWLLEESWGVSYRQAQNETAQSGNTVLEVEPEEAYGALFFTVAETSREAYLYEDLIAVSFWLRPVRETLPLDEMAVTILGSKAQPYWVEDDDSVDLRAGESFFSETRLYYLDMNEAIPAGEWVEVIVWLDQLPFDPDYDFLTGIYIKNGDIFQDTYQIDHVALLTGVEP